MPKSKLSTIVEPVGIMNSEEEDCWMKDLLAIWGVESNYEHGGYTCIEKDKELKLSAEW